MQNKKQARVSCSLKESGGEYLSFSLPLPSFCIEIVTAPASDVGIDWKLRPIISSPRILFFSTSCTAFFAISSRLFRDIPVRSTRFSELGSEATLTV